MQVNREIREKLVLIIGNLMSRCIHEASKVPYVIPKDQVVSMLIEEPELFERLVLEEQQAKTEYSREELTTRTDALTEIGQLKALDRFDMSFARSSDSNAESEPIIEQINLLTRSFIVYTNNTITVFEKEFEMLIEKFRQSLRGRNLSARAIDLDEDDLTGLVRRAEIHLAAGEYVQAFSFDRLLISQVITKDFVQLPLSGYSLSRNLIRSAPKDTARFSELIKFILRVSYVSQGGWQDLFVNLLKLANSEPEIYKRSLFIYLSVNVHLAPDFHPSRCFRVYRKNLRDGRRGGYFSDNWRLGRLGLCRIGRRIRDRDRSRDNRDLAAR
jgi:hypothetical protein